MNEQPAPEDRIERDRTYVRIRYSLQTHEGAFVKGDPDEGLAYLEFFTGYNQVIPGLEKALIGRRRGERLRVELCPEDAFGAPRSELVKERSYEAFPEGRSLEAGRYAVARDEATQTAYGYFVKRKGEKGVVLDFNHPLAGKTLIYDLEVVEARPATEEERTTLRPCEGEDGAP